MSLHVLASCANVVPLRPAPPAPAPAAVADDPRHVHAELRVVLTNTNGIDAHVVVGHSREDTPREGGP